MNQSEVKSLLKELELSPRKMRGQNFLCSDSALEAIVDFADIPRDQNVIEIGPGLGALTRKLLAREFVVTSVEVDAGFCRYLRETFRDESQFTLIEGDVLKKPINEICNDSKENKIYLIGNVPYSISTELILYALRYKDQISSLCFLLQKEFAQRLAAEPGSRTYGSLSVLCRQYFDYRLGPEIDGEEFYPSAKVSSQVIQLRPLPEVRHFIESPDKFEKFVRTLFSQRRKTILNNLKIAITDASRDELCAFLATSGIDSKRRPETITVQEFVNLYRNVFESEGRELK